MVNHFSIADDFSTVLATQYGTALQTAFRELQEEGQRKVIIPSGMVTGAQQESYPMTRIIYFQRLRLPRLHFGADPALQKYPFATLGTLTSTFEATADTTRIHTLSPELVYRKSHQLLIDIFLYWLLSVTHQIQCIIDDVYVRIEVQLQSLSIQEDSVTFTLQRNCILSANVLPLASLQLLYLD